MAQTLAKLAKFFRPIGKGSDDVVAIKLHDRSVTIAEIEVKSNIIHLENLASAALPRPIEWQHLTRQQEMISDSLRGLRDQGLFAANDAAIIIPSHLVTIRQINLPYMSDSELAREGQDSAFWAELEPDINKLEDPFIAYYQLVSSENDDLTRVIIGFCEMATLRPWSDILLGAHLNPTYLDLEPVAMVNYLYASLPRDERRQSQAILHIAAGQAELIAFQTNRFHTIKLEISAFDHVLLAEVEDVDSPTGGFWDEVGGRIANALKQAVLFLQEEQDFSPFSVIYLSVDAPRAKNLNNLLNQHFNLAPLSLWNTLLGAEAAPQVVSLFATTPNNSSFASIFGLGMRKLGTFGDTDPGLIKLSMLPQAASLRRNRQLGVISRALFKFSACITLVMGAWTLGFVIPAFTDTEVKSRGIDTIREEAKAAQLRLAGFREQVQKLETEIANLQVAARPRGKSLILDMLSDLVPEGAELSSYKIEDGNNLKLAGSAKTTAVINLFVSELVNSELIENPQAVPLKRDDKDLFDFTLTGQLRQVR